MRSRRHGYRCRDVCVKFSSLSRPSNKPRDGCTMHEHEISGGAVRDVCGNVRLYSCCSLSCHDRVRSSRTYEEMHKHINAQCNEDSMRCFDTRRDWFSGRIGLERAARGDCIYIVYCVINGVVVVVRCCCVVTRSGNIYCI